eukprot:750640-Amphidinium_carterae.1
MAPKTKAKTKAKPKAKAAAKPKAKAQFAKAKPKAKTKSKAKPRAQARQVASRARPAVKNTEGAECDDGKGLSQWMDEAQDIGGASALLGIPQWRSGDQEEDRVPVRDELMPALLAQPSGNWQSPADDGLRQALGLTVGSYLEIDLQKEEPGRHVAIVQVMSSLGRDDRGWLVEVQMVGHSSPQAGSAVALLYSTGGQGVVHLCTNDARQCPPCALAAGKPLLHVDTWRIRSAESLCESWLPSHVTVAGRGSTGCAAPPLDTQARKMKAAELREKLIRKRGLAEQLAQRAQERVAEQEPRKKKKRSRRRRRSSGSDSSSSRSSARLRSKTPREIAEVEPGRQMSGFLLEVNKQLSGHSAQLATTDLARVRTYLQTLYLPRQAPGAVGMRNTKELSVIAEVLDDLTQGNLHMAGDKLVQRFKAIQKAVADQGWSVAQHLEVAGIAEDTVLTGAEQRTAMREEKLRNQLKRAVDSSGSLSKRAVESSGSQFKRAVDS